jgi:hypothetical protein
MTTASEKDIVDAIVADIAGLGLGVSYETWKYVEPRSLRSDVSKRWLCVYPTRINPEIISTQSSYSNLLRICVSWHYEVFSGLETNVGDQAAAEAALVSARTIRNRLETYGGGIPSLPDVTGEMHETRFDIGANGMWVSKNWIDLELFEGVLQ